MRACLNALRRNARGTSAAMLVLSCVAGSYVVSAQTAPLTLVSTAWPRLSMAWPASDFRYFRTSTRAFMISPLFTPPVQGLHNERRTRGGDCDRYARAPEES